MHQAVGLTGVSTATVKRYAARAHETGDAVRTPVTPGGTKLRWLLNPVPLDRWSRARTRERDAPTHVQRTLTAPPPDRFPTDGPAPIAVNDRLDRLERTLLALAERVEVVWAVATDDVQAARTAALAEKSVSERLRAAQRAQQDAAAARSASQRLQEQAAEQARVAADMEAEAATALGRALDARSAQLDQLLIPGSAAGMMSGGTTRHPKRDSAKRPAAG